jgi:hypothetical protein
MDRKFFGWRGIRNLAVKSIGWRQLARRLKMPTRNRPNQAGNRTLEWDKDNFKLDGLTFILEFGPGIATAQAKYPNFILMKSREMIEDYAARLADRRFDNVLELGIMKGGSAAFFNALLKPANHLAVDVYQHESGLTDLAAIIGRDGRRFLARYDISQTDTLRIARIFEECFETDAHFDLIIDDASHNYDASLAAFNGLFPLVKPGGIYALEDWGWAHWGGAFQDPSHAEYQNPALSNLVLQCVLCSTSRAGAISRVDVTPNTAFIHRGADPLLEQFDVARAYLTRNREFHPL